MSAYSNAFSQAIEILLYIHFKSLEEKYEFLSTRIMSDGLNIPIPTLNKVITKLKNAELIISKAGPSGGLALAKNIEEINLLDVFLTVEGHNPLFSIHKSFNRDILYETQILDRITKNGTHMLDKAERNMHETLNEYYLSDLL